jgi:hypothetical protein
MSNVTQACIFNKWCKSKYLNFLLPGYEITGEKIKFFSMPGKADGGMPAI